jgi:hypothetical protein
MMKKNRIVLAIVGGVTAVAMLALGTWSLDSSKGSYRKKSLPNLETTSVEDAEAWMRARYIDETTGQPITKEKLEQIRKKFAKMNRSKSIAFMEQGPDNIGGRTRAIQVDRTNINRVWAGGVSGGLFVSNNRGDFWTRVDSYINDGASPYISSMTQTPDGTLFVATGFEGKFNEWFGAGNGVWYSTDFGGSWTKINGTTTVTEIVTSDVATDNWVWMATSTGLKKWKIGETSLTTVTPTAGSCNTIQISKDGQVVVGAFGSNKTFVSTNGGQDWVDKSGSGSGVVPSGAPRIEYAISHQRVNGKYSLYAVRTNSNLSGMNVSHDDGNTWSQFVGASSTPSNLDIYRNQGGYNSIVTVVPTDNEKILIGGIDVWQWKQTVNNPPSGGFEKLSNWFLPPFSDKYAHADQHEMKWDNLNRLYVGNDGGVNITDDYGINWYPANRGYNVTQFYGIAFDRDGAVMGGTQDNGTLYNDHTLSTFQEFREVTGGDGFECEISFFNPRVMFSSIYYNSIQRSGDRGQTWSSFVPTFPGTYDPAGTDGSSFHPFHTEFVFAEHYDTNSEDSVTFVPTKNYAAGSIVKVPSLASGDTILYETQNALYFDDTLHYDPSEDLNDISVVNSLNGQTVLLGNYTWTPFTSASGSNPPIVGDTLLVNFPTGADTVVVGSLGTYVHHYGINPATGELYSMGSDTIAFNVAWDTLIVQDPYQSWFLMYVNANGGELWGTRNAARLSASDPQWVIVAKGIGGGLNNNIDVEFSRDLNRCYVSAGNGVFRIDDLGSIYTSDPNFETKAGYHGTGLNTLPSATNKVQITTTDYEGIAVNPNNASDLVCFPAFGGTVRRSLNATSATPSFTALSVIAGGVACYDGIIDRDDSDIIVVGTSEGVVVTEDGGGTWENASAGFEGTPVFEVRQSWRTWDEGNARPGEIYIGTFGRGIWSSAAYLGIGEYDNNGNQIFKTKLKTYPNPTNDYTTLTFSLKETSNVNVYVYSITGTLVKTITNKNVPEGAQTLTINCDDLQRGTYIVKFVAGKQNDSVKFIKL